MKTRILVFCFALFFTIMVLSLASANLIEHKQISVWDVLPNEKITKILKKVYSKKDSLKSIKRRLKDEASYDELACVMASIKSKRKKCPR